MLDRETISQRFFSCYPGTTRREMGLIFGVTKGAVTGWTKKRNVPWRKLKYLSDSQAVSWDWLLASREPKSSLKKPVILTSTNPDFDSEGITQRFYSLYPGMKQIEIAASLKVTTTTVNDWKRNKRKVSWERLADAVDTFDVTWDWLIDGLEPKYRE